MQIGIYNVSRENFNKIDFFFIFEKEKKEVYA